MPTLAETFAKRVLKPDQGAMAAQRNAIIESMFNDIEQINADLEAINSGLRFRFTGGRGGSVHSYQLRFESGFANNSGTKCSSRMLYVEFPMRSAEIIICKDDWGELPDIKTDPDEIYTVFTLDGAQSARDMMVDEMMGVLSDTDTYELKRHYGLKRREQQAQDAAPQ